MNYSPYENSGHILEYLLQNFEKVYLFSIAFHTLGKKSQNKFTIYKKGKLYSEEYLFYMDVPESLVFFFIPFRSVLNALQIVIRIIKIKNNYGAIDVFFTVNAFTATLGRFLKKLYVVKQTVFWVWDYYPIRHPSILATIMRRLYWQFDKYATHSDRVIYLHKRLADVRKKTGVISKNEKCIVVPIGTGERIRITKKDTKIIKIGFIGVLKKSQGVDMILDSGVVLSKHFKHIVFEIIGSGPDEEYFIKRKRNTKLVTYNFYGYVNEEKFRKILSGCMIGIAPYKPEKSTMSSYTDPGKPKRYIEFNLPVITTDVIEFSKEIEKNGAGIVIKYNDLEEFAQAIKIILKNYPKYRKDVIRLHEKYYYKKIYPTIFSF
ncbi:MAG TPA: glycosyltransferase [Verrucomicrobiae bacterium]|nr:glycosyltransferase [Verrucomicrobiae bacterium]